MYEAEMSYWALQGHMKYFILMAHVHAKSTVSGIITLIPSQGREAHCGTGILCTIITPGSAQISLHKIVARQIFQME